MSETAIKTLVPSTVVTECGASVRLDATDIACSRTDPSHDTHSTFVRAKVVKNGEQVDTALFLSWTL